MQKVRQAHPVQMGQTARLAPRARLAQRVPRVPLGQRGLLVLPGPLVQRVRQSLPVQRGLLVHQVPRGHQVPRVRQALPVRKAILGRTAILARTHPKNGATHQSPDRLGAHQSLAVSDRLALARLAVAVLARACL